MTIDAADGVAILVVNRRLQRAWRRPWPTVALCGVPAVAVMLDAAPAVLVRLKEAGEADAGDARA